LGTWHDFIWEPDTILFGNLARFHLGTWHDFIWELGTILFGELADFRPARWRIFVRRVGGFLFGELAKCCEIQKNNSTIQQNYRTFVPDFEP